MQSGALSVSLFCRSVVLAGVELRDPQGSPGDNVLSSILEMRSGNRHEWPWAAPAPVSGRSEATASCAKLLAKFSAGCLTRVGTFQVVASDFSGFPG